MGEHGTKTQRRMLAADETTTEGAHTSARLAQALNKMTILYNVLYGCTLNKIRYFVKRVSTTVQSEGQPPFPDRSRLQACPQTTPPVIKLRSHLFPFPVRRRLLFHN